MTAAEITTLAIGLGNILSNVLTTLAEVQSGRLDPSTLKPEDLMPATAQEILDRVRREQGQAKTS